MTTLRHTAFVLCSMTVIWGACTSSAFAQCGVGGDCCAAHLSPSCDDVDCCQEICAVDPFCCNTEWDNSCAGQAFDLCFELPAGAVDARRDPFAGANVWPALPGFREAVGGYYAAVFELGRRLLRGLGRRRQANDGRAIQQLYQMLPPDNAFDFRQPFLIMRQHLVAGNLVLLQFTNHVAIVGRCQVALFGDLGRDGLHFTLQLREPLMSQARQLFGRIVNAEIC